LLKSPLEILWIDANYDEISYANMAKIVWEKLLGVGRNKTRCYGINRNEEERK